MVMNAKKIRRFDDGYTDKREARPFQTSQYPSKNYSYSQGERYDKKRSPSNSNDSPSCRNSPRYINKSSYSERAKERHERDRAGPSPGKMLNHTGSYPGTSNHSNNGHHGNVSENRLQTSRSNSNPKDTKDRDVQKSALQTCGDWAEHISSNGKKYYYNSKTEVSQWEKPKEWITMHSAKPDRHSADSRTANDRLRSTKDDRNRHSSGPEKREKHLGDLRYMVQEPNSKPDKQFLFDKLQASQTKLQEERAASMAANRHHHPMDHRSSEHVYKRNDSVASHTSSSLDYHSSSSRRHRRDSEGTRPLGRSRHDRRHEDGYDDMDISPGSTPTSSRPSSCTGTPQIGAGNTPLPNACTSGPTASSSLNIASLPRLINQLSGGQTNQELTQKALDTIQKLQEALSRQIAAVHSSVEGQASSQSQPVNTASPQALSEDLLSSHSQHHPHQQHQHIPSVHNQSHPNHHHHHHHLHHQQQTQQQQQSQLQHQHQHQPQQRSPYLGNHTVPPSLTSPHPISSQSLPPVSIPAGYMSSCTASSSSSTAPQTSIPISQVFPHSQAQTVYGKLAGAQNRTATPETAQQEEESRGHGSPSSHCDRSSCGSPAPSETSSQGAEVDPDMLSAATNIQKENSLMSSLGQYYNEKLVSHVTGWQAEHAERQARRYWEESLSVGSVMCSQVSVELKQARSAVRVKEIHATLREQRNLFLAQQVSELENMKPVSSFLSSS